ncbi:hypothetical protein Mal33_13640 [Rosistilla oblonga]|uniref:HEAT repeat protein n=2 Tax=Rosistilla oblonga TaxID=2527990 RepID=A0A518IQQ2_9BACT|nr:hypothetical protein Mal33_13640 [Rosistilla oblonga]
MTRYGNKYLDFAFDVLSLVWGDPITRIPKFLLVAGVSLIASPWWLPFIYQVVETRFGIDTRLAAKVDIAVFISGWVLVALGMGLWVHARKNPSDVKITRVFRDWPRLQQRMSNRLHEQLKKEQYNSGLDVRPSFSIDRVATIVSGTSGQGKTWRLARTAIDALKSDSLVVWIPASRGKREPLEYAAQEICDYGLEVDAQLTIERIAFKRQESTPNINSPWAVFCIDGVRSHREAERLIQLDWDRWGISFVMSTSVEIARDLAFNAGLPIETIRDFDHSELRSYLERRKRSWVNIAPDVRELIRRPILAKLYADVVDDQHQFRPRNEYDLMEASWLRLTNPVEVGLIRKIAGTIGDETKPYPWLTETVLEAGFTPDLIEKLINRGLLHDVGDGRVAIWHQRFLCWAFAKHLTAQFVSGVLSLERLVDAMVKCQRVPDSRRLQLGYVPMDVLWLLLASDLPNEKRKSLWKLVAALETSEGWGYEDASLYTHLLASLGERAIPLLLDRVRSIENLEHSGVVDRSADALRIIGRDNIERLSTVARECVADGTEALSELGLRLAVSFPRSVDVERVWEEYRRCIVDDEKSSGHFVRRDRASMAFAAVAAENLTWLKQQLQNGDTSDPCFTSLVFTLANMPGLGPKRVWEETKNHLIASISPEKRRCLTACIVCFCDSGEYPRLEEWASSEHELVGMVSAQGLSFRDPARGIQILPRVASSQLWGAAGAIGTALIAFDRVATCVAVESLVAGRVDPEHYFDLIANHGDRLTPNLVEKLLDWLNDVLERHLTAGDDSKQQHPRYPLRLIEALHGENVLSGLRSRQGRSLEEHLEAFATSRIEKISGWVDHEFEHSRELLKRIAGDGFTKLTNSLIRADHQQLRMEGCELAVMRPSAETRDLLVAAAVSDDMWDSGSSSINLVQMRAIDSLAALGENAGVVNGILTWGLSVSPDIGDLRDGQREMNDEELAPAIALLKDSSNKRYGHAILAIGQSGRQDLREVVENALLACDTDCELVNYCLLALEDLPSDCSRTLKRFVEQYRSGHYKFAVLKALSGCSTPNETYLEMLPTDGKHDDMDQRILAYLAADESTRTSARSHVDRILETGGSHMNDTVALLDPSQESDQKLLWEKTLQPDSGMHYGGSRAQALRSLGKIAPDAAFEIGLETLTTDRRDREIIPRVLLELDPERAVLSLCRAASESNDKLLCCDIARALRGVAEISLVNQVITELLRDESWMTRRAAAFMAGFLSSAVAEDALRQIAYGDPKWGVCSEAQSAIRKRQREKEARKLLLKLCSIDSCQVWGTLDCIIRLADPGVAVATGDPIGFLNAVRGHPFVVGKYVSKELKKRTKKLEDEMKSLHGKWKDND